MVRVDNGRRLAADTSTTVEERRFSAAQSISPATSTVTSPM
jgi:hypothetical protein